MSEVRSYIYKRAYVIASYGICSGVSKLENYRWDCIGEAVG